MNPEEKYLEGIDISNLPPQAREVLIALGQFHDKQPITAKCSKCQNSLTVEERGYAWFISCPCGFCNNIARGLLKQKSNQDTTEILCAPRPGQGWRVSAILQGSASA